MKRVLVTTIFVIILCSFWQSIFIYLPALFNVIFLAPVILVFSLQYFKPLEALATCLFVGSVLDIQGGSWIGINILLMLCFTFFIGSLNLFVGRMPKYNLFVYLILISFLYRISFLLLQFICFGTQANFYLLQFFTGPFLDAMVSLVLYYLLAKILVFLKGMDYNDYFKPTIGIGK